MERKFLTDAEASYPAPVDLHARVHPADVLDLVFGDELADGIGERAALDHVVARHAGQEPVGILLDLDAGSRPEPIATNSKGLKNWGSNNGYRIVHRTPTGLLPITTCS
jgi:hypothetical protein